MMDYTYNSIPIAQVPTEKLVTCLRDGICVNETDGLPIAEAERRIFKRIELELYIRSIGAR